MLFLLLFLTSPEVFVYEVPNNILLSYVSTHFTFSKQYHIRSQTGLQFYTHILKLGVEFFSLSLNVGYTSIHDIAMVLREENVYSYDNATMFGQGDLSHSLY